MSPLRFTALAAWALLLAPAAHAQGPSAITSTLSSSLASTTFPTLSLSAAPTVVSGCPAAVSTTDICTTCVTAACVIEQTITVPCGCPSPPLTIYSSHPCSLGCSGLGCATVYKAVTEACTGASGPVTGTAVPPSGSAVHSGSSVLITANAGCRVAPFRFW